MEQTKEVFTGELMSMTSNDRWVLSLGRVNSLTAWIITVAVGYAFVGIMTWHDCFLSAAFGGVVFLFPSFVLYRKIRRADGWRSGLLGGALSVLMLFALVSFSIPAIWMIMATIESVNGTLTCR